MNSRAVAYSVVVPVFDSTESVRELAARTDRVFKDVVGASYELILVDDGSPNSETWPTLQALSEQYAEVRAIQLTRNFGKPGAVMCGFSHARGDYVITLDDDLQHRPEDIPTLIAEQSHDVVIGELAHRKHSLVKRGLSRIKSWFDAKLIGRPKHVRMTPFKLYQAHVIRSMLTIQTPYPFVAALLLYTTRDIAMVQVEHGERKYGRSGFTYARMINSFLNLLINNSSFLLRAVSALGVLISAVSMALGLFFVLKNLIVGVPVPGWTSLIVVTLVTNGLLLFAVGVIGEYLIRVINGTERRPSFIVRQVQGRDPKRDDS